MLHLDDLVVILHLLMQQPMIVGAVEVGAAWMNMQRIEYCAPL